MEKTHVLLLEVRIDSKLEIQNKISKLYPNLICVPSGETDTTSKYLLKIPTYELLPVILTKIESISGVISIVEQPQDKLSGSSRNYSKLLMIGLGIFLASLIIATFLIPNNPLEKLSNAQILLIEVSIALAVSIWIFLYDKKSQEGIVKVLSNINGVVNETNQYIKDMDNN